MAIEIDNTGALKYLSLHFMKQQQLDKYRPHVIICKFLPRDGALISEARDI